MLRCLPGGWLLRYAPDVAWLPHLFDRPQTLIAGLDAMRLFACVPDVDVARMEE